MSTATATAEPPVMSGGTLAWISGKAATEIAGISYERLRALAGSGEIAVRRIPGCHPRYRLADALRLGRPA